MFYYIDTVRDSYSDQFNIWATVQFVWKCLQEHISWTRPCRHEIHNVCIRCSPKCLLWLRSKWAEVQPQSQCRLWWTASFGSLPAAYFGTAEQGLFAAIGFFFMVNYWQSILLITPNRFLGEKNIQTDLQLFCVYTQHLLLQQEVHCDLKEKKLHRGIFMVRFLVSHLLPQMCLKKPQSLHFHMLILLYFTLVENEKM